ncbi:MAG: glycosyltransferase family 2 protein [Butyrivibrio sp.]|nr:glycosyltransferase family 2 protein [Butyrivibrio sp.]MBR1642063.1 glycosyltransferase family 2 protein [Butyrivibrio sp.]
MSNGVSIIIPIYNEEKLIGRCLDSVYSQDYKDIEVILVDDGSTDKSSEIIDYYSEKCGTSTPTVVVHKKNEGLIKARIDGLLKANYELVSFVDSDDWIEPNHISVMAKEMICENADVIVEGCLRHDGSKSDLKINKIPEGIYEDDALLGRVFPKMLCYEGFFSFGILPYMWNKIFKRDMLIRCYEDLDISVYDGEDVLTFFSYMMNVKKLIVRNEASYHYCLTPKSMTKIIKDDYLEKVFCLYLNLKKNFSKSIYYPVLKEQLDKYIRMMVKRSDPESFISDEQYFFPYNTIPAGSEVIVYGAGLVGKSYVHQIRHTRFCNIAAWVDREYEKKEVYEGVSVNSPLEIPRFHYDFVVVAISDENIALRIKEYLIGELGVSEEKIVF